MTDTTRNPVDVLAADFARRLKSGEKPSIDEYVEQHPEHASTIRAMFPSIELMERVGKQERTEQEFDRRTQSLAKKGRTLGDFRIIRELGRGGMGIVYEAEQQSLRRRVALKVLAPHVADSPEQLTRFRREAKAAARLHHTNIVPVYGVGEADGLHFFAMQFIDGVTLQEKLNAEAQEETTVHRVGESVPNHTAALPEDTPTTIESITNVRSDLSAGSQTNRVTSSARRRPTNTWQESARLVRDVAYALSYAHEQGVHHRDIKPGNLLLDDDGTVWVSDFGLAKHESDDAATRTGDIIGTLRYMAPEQFNAQTDGRSDICSLGLTLYELLTHEPAYTEVKAAALMKMKTQEPPPNPRAIEPGLPADLVTITLKASAMDPSDRYQAAGELADDLDRFLNDLPILARRITAPERLWRWARRNPVVAGLSAGVFALLITTAAVFAFGNYRTGRALETARSQRERARQEWRRAEDNLIAARAASARAEKNFQMAVDAFEQIMANISSRGSAQSLAVEVDGEELAPPSTVVTAADAALLETLLGFFDLFASENRTDLSHKTADALARVGRIQQRLGSVEDAEESFEESLRVYRTLEQNTGDTTLRRQQAAIHRELMLLAAAREDSYTALRHYQQATHDLADLTDPEDRFELALTMSTMAGLPGASVRRTVEVAGGRRGGPGGPGWPGPGRGMRPGERLPGRGPGERGDRGGRGFGQRGGRSPGMGLGGRMDPARRPRGGGPGDRGTRELRDEARRAAAQSVEILSQLTNGEPSNREYRLELARAHRRSVEAFRFGSREEAQTALSEAISQLERLVEDSPNSPVYRFELATTLCMGFSGNPVEHAVRTARAINLARELTKDYPGIPEYQSLLASALGIRTATKRGAPEAAGEWTEIVSIYRGLHRQFPESFAYRVSLCVALRSLAGTRERTNPEQARESITEAIALLGPIVKSQTLVRDQQRIAEGLLRHLQGIESRLGQGPANP